MILVPGFFLIFWVGLCLKFDGKDNISVFILLIPLWLIAIPLFIFIVLNGVAVKTSRASKCEKITLSIFVPSKIAILIITCFRRFHCHFRIDVTLSWRRIQNESVLFVDSRSDKLVLPLLVHAVFGQRHEGPCEDLKRTCESACGC